MRTCSPLFRRGAVCEISSDDKPGLVVAIFPEIRRCSSAVATGGGPNPAALERLKAQGLELSPRCLALWDEEVSRELSAQII